MLVNNRPLYFCQGCSQGKLSELNDPVLFHNHIEKYTYADAGAYRLPSDVPTESGK